MSERDELADLIWEEAAADRVKDGTRASLVPVVRSKVEAMAARILAAGYRKPRVITKAAERAFLQPGTICMDRDGNAWKRGTGSWVSTGGDTGPLYDEDDLELTVLHEGSQP